MAHTVIDPAAPTPPMQSGWPVGALPTGGSPRPRAAPPPKRRAPWFLIGTGLFATSVLAVVTGYFSLFYYSPVALFHVPSSTALAIRINIADIALFEPMRRHLLPLMDEPMQGGAPSKNTQKARSERVFDALGIRPRDLREAVLCFVGGVNHYLVIVGGRIPKGKLVPGLMKVAAEEGSTEWIQNGDTIKGKTIGIVIGQAEDGSAILASDQETLGAALPATADYKALGIPENGSIGYAALGQLWKGLDAGPLASLSGGLRELKQFESVNGRIALGNNPKIESQVLLANGVNPEQAKAALYSIVTTLRRVSELRRQLMASNADLAGEEQALAQSTIETKGPHLLSMVTLWPYEGLDRGAQHLAERFRALRTSAGTPLPAPSGLVLPGGIQLPLPGMMP